MFKFQTWESLQRAKNPQACLMLTINILFPKNGDFCMACKGVFKRGIFKIWKKWQNPEDLRILVRKRPVNATLAMGHQADPPHCYNFIFTGEFAGHNILQYFGGDWGRRRIARIDSRRYKEDSEYVFLNSGMSVNENELLTFTKTIFCSQEHYQRWGRLRQKDGHRE